MAVVFSIARSRKDNSGVFCSQISKYRYPAHPLEPSFWKTLNHDNDTRQILKTVL